MFLFDAIRDLISRDWQEHEESSSHSAEPPPLQQYAGDASASPSPRDTSLLDYAQTAADVVGVADQTGITDLLNASVSAVRALFAKDTEERWSHLQDAGIRAISAVPLVGDLAKTGRAARYMDEAADVARFVSRSADDVVETVAKPVSRAADDVAAPVAKATEQTAEQAAQEYVDNRLKKSFPEWKPKPPAAPPTLDDMVGPKPKLEDYANRMDWVDARAEWGLKRADAKKQLRRQERERQSVAPPDQPPTEPPGSGPPSPVPAPDGDVPGGEPASVKAEDQLEDSVTTLTSILGKAVKGVGGFVTALYTAPPAIAKFADLLVYSSRDRAMLSGGSASELAQTDIQQLLLNMKTARETEDSTVTMLESVQEFRQEYQKLESFYQDITNTISGWGMWIGTYVAKAANWTLEITSIKDQIKELVDLAKKEQDDKGHTRGEQFLMHLKQQRGGNRPPLPPIE